MSDEAALLSAVLSNPDSDAPRLAYAEWLRRQEGASNQARAEFIQVQVEIEKCVDNDPKFPQFARRERELLAEWGPTWERPFRDMLKPSLFRPGRWLKARLFGQGGAWRFHSGFIEEIDTSAAGFLEEDGLLCGHAPIRRVVLSNATSLIAALVEDRRLDNLFSLHLVADAEFDEEMEGLRQAATTIDLGVIELRFPRIQAEAGDLISLLRGDEPDISPRSGKLRGFRNWARATERERDRWRELARKPRWVQRLTESEHFSHSELLRLNEWIYLGTRLHEAGAWAVVKTFHDLADDEGLCRRLILFKKDRIRDSAYQALLDSPHRFHEDSLRDTPRA